MTALLAELFVVLQKEHSALVHGHSVNTALLFGFLAELARADASKKKRLIKFITEMPLIGCLC